MFVIFKYLPSVVFLTEIHKAIHVFLNILPISIHPITPLSPLIATKLISNLSHTHCAVIVNSNNLISFKYFVN